MWEIEPLEFRNASNESPWGFRLLLLVVGAGSLFLSACGGPSGPGDAARAAYRLISEGELTKAENVLLIDDGDRALGRAEAMLEGILTQGAIDEFRVISEDVDGATGTVVFYIRHADGDELLEAREVRRIDGDWKLVLDTRPPFSPTAEMAYMAWRAVYAQGKHKAEHDSFAYDVQDLLDGDGIFLGAGWTFDGRRSGTQLDPRVSIRIEPGAAADVDTYTLAVTWKGAPDSYACTFERNAAFVECNGRYVARDENRGTW